MKATAMVDAKVTRGPQSWGYIYVTFGFAVAIEGTVIRMIDPLKFPWNLVAYVMLAVLTGWLFLFNGWFQNKLIGIKNRYENISR